MSNNDFKKVIAASNTGKKFPVLSLLKDSSGLAATIAKLVPSINPIEFDTNGNRTPSNPNSYAFKSTSDKTSQNINDNRTVLQLLPDLELAAQILVSSIIAPKDMVTSELTFSVPDGFIAPDVTAALIEVVKKYFEQDYKIKPLMSKMLRDMLFETGSYAVAVIPENSLDEVINGNKKITLEALSDSINRDGSVKSIGLLGPAILPTPIPARASGGLSLEGLNNFNPRPTTETKITFESILDRPAIDHLVTVTDNYNLLKIPQINQKIRESRIKELTNTSLESNAIINDRELSRIMYKEKDFSYKPITTLKTQEQLNRKTVGNPLVIHLPSESVIPVFVPGCPSEQVGFFILIDANGNPVSTAEDADYYQQLSNRLNSNGSFPSAMLNRVKSQMQGFQPNNKEHIDYTIRAYGDMVEQDLLSRLRNGVYGNGVALAKNEEIYRIMFARALAKQHTQLLFIPVELMTYFAFNYTSSGIGKSLLDDMKIINSLRSMVMFANVMSSLKNSIGRTDVKLKLDETDPNPQKTIEIAMHEIIRTRQQYFPLGMNSPTDLTDWLQKSGFEFTFEGHPGLPDVSIDFGEKNSNFIKPDTELEENLRKRSIMATGLSPETVDASFQAEFATSIVANNILLAKRVTQTQEEFTPLLSSHIRKVSINSENLVNSLRNILIDNFDKLEVELTEYGKEIEAKKKEGSFEIDETTKLHNTSERNVVVNTFLNEFIMNLEVKLPQPNSVSLESQMTAMETYTKALDMAIEAWISEKFFNTDLGGDIANQVTTIKEVIKAYYLRKWMSDNGVMTELSQLSIKSYDGSPAVDLWKVNETHIENLTKSLTKFLEGIQLVKNASDTVVKSLGGVEESSEVENTPSETPPDDSGLPEMPEIPEEEPIEESKEPEEETNLNDEPVEKEKKEEEK